jgi:hypothetical protein
MEAINRVEAALKAEYERGLADAEQRVEEARRESPVQSMRVNREAPSDEDCLKNYDEFWRELVEMDGQIDVLKLARELHDFYRVMHTFAVVYCEITGDRCSKLLYDPSVYVSQFEDRMQEEIREAEEKARQEGARQEREAHIKTLETFASDDLIFDGEPHPAMGPYLMADELQARKSLARLKLKQLTGILRARGEAGS